MYLEGSTGLVSRFSSAAWRRRADFGGGPVGLNFVKPGRLFGLGCIGLVDRHPEKQAKARAFGADSVLTPCDPAIADLPQSHGRLDVAIDAIGKAELVNIALPLLKRGGSIGIYRFLAGLGEFSVDNARGDYNYNLFVHQWPTRL